MQTTYADSTCIQAIIRAVKQAQQLDKTIDLVVEKDSYLEKLVSVTGLGRMFRIYGSLEEAIYLPNSDATKQAG